MALLEMSVFLRRGTFLSKKGLLRPRKNAHQSRSSDGRHMGWHDLRYTFASRLAQEGISIYKICKWLGHSDIKTTQIYAHFAPVYDEDIEKLSLVKQQ